ncbi:MAG: hypothetical protein O3A55_03460 [Bacteroidetes bacterium]|nr:hypothetical protein [Bacteroidota bacterium]
MKLLLISIFLFFTSCVNPFAPKLDFENFGSSAILSDQKDIEGVLHNFKQAYLFKDTTIYGKLFTPEFIFIFRDYDKNTEVFWSRDEELRTTNGLFQNAQHFELIWNQTISSHEDSLLMQLVKSFNLTVTFNPNDIVRVNGYANFTFSRESILEKWKISRWRDESNF